MITDIVLPYDWVRSIQSSGWCNTKNLQRVPSITLSLKTQNKLNLWRPLRFKLESMTILLSIRTTRWRPSHHMKACFNFLFPWFFVSRISTLALPPPPPHPATHQITYINIIQTYNTNTGDAESPAFSHEIAQLCGNLNTVCYYLYRYVHQAWWAGALCLSHLSQEPGLGGQRGICSVSGSRLEYIGIKYFRWFEILSV